MGLTEEMRAAAEASPPTGIDLDELVRKGRANRTRSRAAIGLAGVAGFVAVALGTVGTYSLTAAPHPNHPVGIGGPQPTVSTHPYVTPSTTLVIIQLQDAVQSFPASMHVPDDVRFSYGGVQPGSQADLGYYYASWTFGHVNYVIDVYVGNGHSTIGSEDACDPQHRGDPSLGCSQVTDRFGVTITLSNADRASTQRITTVDNFRSDGSAVSIFVEGRGTARIPSKADIQAASHVPGLSVTK